MNISFGSSYTINKTRQTPPTLIDKLYNLENKGGSVLVKYTSSEHYAKTGVSAIYSVNTPDDMDMAIEALLISNGIDFHKTTTEDSLDLENIKSRIELGYWEQNTHTLVEIDTEKLNELFKKDGIAYIEPQGGNGIGKRYAGVIEYLKTGRPIEATTVFLNKRYDGLSASIGDGRHRFAVLRDMGMKKIPVALHNESLELAKEYGLI